MAAAPNDPPAPLFGDVHQLTPTSLPEGWGRCTGGRGLVQDAGERSWSQTFGPMDGGSCTPLVTVTQIAPGEGRVELEGAEDIKIGEADGARWTEEDGGRRAIFTWAFDQNLIVEACCDERAWAHLEQMALAALEGTRQTAPPGCTTPASDLDGESLATNLQGKAARLVDDEGCPVRIDIASMRTLPADDHCWPGVTIAVVLIPPGSTAAEDRHSYLRDPDGMTGRHTVARPFEPDAQLPPGAVDTGYSRQGRRIWVDPLDKDVLYVVDADGVEAWPRLSEQLFCA